MQITEFQLSRGVYEGCQDAVYNLKVVTSCPKSKEEWNIASSIKNCSAIAAVAKKKNCTIDEIHPKYHCVINAFRNKFLEVCADEKIIFGYCAEFNENGRTIQSHYTASCKKVSPKCDDAYSSLDAYKYPGCYKLVNQIKVGTAYPESGYVGIIIFIATSIAVVLCGSIVAIILLKRRKGSDIQKQEKDIEEHQSLNESALENTISKEAESEPFRQYLYCKASRFPHFVYVYNQIWEYQQQLHWENMMLKKVIIKIELVGDFTDGNLQLLPRGKLNKRIKNEEHIWEQIPLLCFQNDVSLKSALETRPGERACHSILIKPVLDASDKKDDSIIIVNQNKDNILKAITSCLEQPLCCILQELSDFYSECTERSNEIMALKKMMLAHNEHNETPTVPDNIKKYLSGISDVVEYTMMRNSSLQVQVKKESDEREFRNNLMKVDSTFFEKCRLDIVKRKMVKRYTSKRKDVGKINDDERNKIASTSGNEFTNNNQTAYGEDGYVSSKEELLVLDSPNTQTENYQRGEKSASFEGNRYEDDGKNTEIKVHNLDFNSALQTISPEHSDDSNDLDFDNRDLFYK